MNEIPKTFSLFIISLAGVPGVARGVEENNLIKIVTSICWDIYLKLAHYLRMFFSNSLLPIAHNLFTGRQLSLFTIFLSLSANSLSLSHSVYLICTLYPSLHNLFLCKHSLSLFKHSLSLSLSLLLHTEITLIYLFTHTLCILSLSLCAISLCSHCLPFVLSHSAH